MRVFVNYPKTNEGEELLLDNLATFRAQLLLKSIDNLMVDEMVKEEVFEKILEILELEG